MTSKRGVLIRTIPVQLLNVSASGFLLESQQRINAGTTGILDVDAGTTRYLSPANLLRAVRRPDLPRRRHAHSVDSGDQTAYPPTLATIRAGVTSTSRSPAAIH